MTNGHYGVVYAAHAGDFDYRYVGQSIKPNDRFAAHRRNARNLSPLYVHRWMNSVGVENVEFEVLAHADTPDSLNELEKYWIAQLTSAGFSLTNLNGGGQGQLGLGGENAPGAKITRGQAQEIVDRLLNTNDSCETIAADYGVTQGNVSAIARGETWTAIPRAQKLRTKFQPAEEQILEAISLIHAGHSVTDVARKLGLSGDLIGRVARGDLFKEVPRPDNFYAGYHRGHKLNDSDVKQIRERMDSGERQRVIASDYGISEVMVRNIRRGKMWSHLPDPYNLASRDLRSGKLSDEQVREIRLRGMRGDLQKDIASDFHITQPEVSRIIHRKTYAGVLDVI